MKDIYIVFDNIDDLNLLEDAIDSNYFLHYWNINKHNDRSKAFKFKGEWGAKQNPFVLISENDKVIKAYYSETGDNAVKQFINDYESTSI